MLFRYVTRIPAKDNNGGRSSDFYSKSFFPRFSALGDPCLFFYMSVSFTVESYCEIENPSFSVDYFYLSTPAPSNIC